MLTRYPIGIAATLIALSIAGLRLAYLFRLVHSGKPAPDRLRRWGRKAEVEATEVVGQRRLLKWTVPGLAHAFTFWGFTVLILTIIEAYGDLFQKNFAIPGIGHAAVVGFIEDFFACAVLVSLSVFTVIRLRNSPKRKDRASRFYGSHTTAAWITLGMIALVVITLLLYRAAADQHRRLPLRLVGIRLPRHRPGPAPARAVGQSDARDGVPGSERDRDRVVSGLRRVLQAPSHLHGTLERRLLPPAHPARRPRQDARDRHRDDGRGHDLRRRQDRALHAGNSSSIS